MPARMLVELPDGKKLLFGGRGAATGLGEVGIADDIARASADRFKAGLATLAEVFQALDDSVAKLARRPDKLEMEFRASLSGECDLWIVSGEGEAEVKVTVSWER